MRIDLHNHTTLCKHATGTMEEYIKKAIDLGIDIFGFSCHAPMSFESEYRMSLAQSKIYQNDVLNLKEKYKNQIKILLAYEVDFMNNKEFLEDDILNANIDYLIGSVHFIDRWGFDNPEFIGDYKDKDINAIWRLYFATVSQMVKTGYFNIIGHLDLIKIFNYLPTVDIQELAYDTMVDIKNSGMVIEINSAGFRKPIQEQYPSKELLQLAYKLGIPITFGSDAHSVEQVGLNYHKVSALAREIGYQTCVTFEDKKQIEIKF